MQGRTAGNEVQKQAIQEKHCYLREPRGKVDNQQGRAKSMKEVKGLQPRPELPKFHLVLRELLGQDSSFSAPAGRFKGQSGCCVVQEAGMRGSGNLSLQSSEEYEPSST